MSARLDADIEGNHSHRMLFGVAISLSAFLLFLVQPLIARYILPWFGGSASVWSITLLFFQTTLLLGYGYAHFIVSRVRPRTQVLIHIGVVAAALLVLPIVPMEALRPDGSGSPTADILILLAVTVGAPYLVLSATGPLLQAWFSRTRPGRSPYRLYALSNAASLLGLLAYPLVIERYLSLRHQAWLWSAGYVVFAIATAAVARVVIVRDAKARRPSKVEIPTPNMDDPSAGAKGGWAVRLLWVALPGTAVVMLLAVTNQMTLEVAQIPLLWVLPMTAYLLSFIVMFARPAWYRRGVFGALLVVAMTLVVRTLVYDTGSLSTQIMIYSAGLFFITLALHGELVRLTPPARNLTGFYLMIATGGALGGAAVALVAPRVFSGLWELHAGLLATAGLVGLSWFRESRARSVPTVEAGPPTAVRARFSGAVAVMGLIALFGGSVLMVRVLLEDIRTDRDGVITVERSFYGVLRIVSEDADDPQEHQISILHGPIEHGFQYVADSRADLATTYYSSESGVGIALRELRNRSASNASGDRGLSIGVVGLGAGTLAAYGSEGDSLTFYEIDPVVVELSQEHFTFLSRAEARGADIEVLVGDARLEMERQIRLGQAPRFDLLALDAFNGDAVPVHLLTREAFEVYWQLLAEDGTLAVHVSSLHLDLAPVVRKLAELHGKEAILIDSGANDAVGAYGADWILVTSNRQVTESAVVAAAATPWSSDSRPPLLWTDDYSNLLTLID